jgi:adenosylmethionine-8-amino-7-oxononanoate aminotransferase
MTPMARRSTWLWHPFANMADVAKDEVVFARGEGAILVDEAGKRYLDATASLWYCNVGHGRAELAEAAAVQMRKLEACSSFDRLTNRPALELAERIARLAAPVEDGAVFFTSGGSESIDTAAKLVRRYWALLGRPERQLIVVREGAYHGMAGYGTSLAGIEGNYTGIGDLVPGVVRVPAHDAEALQRVFAEHGGRVAAFFGEPVIGAGGVRPPREGYWDAVAQLCRAHDVLLAVDEVITGFGRLGTWFGSERYRLQPDLLIGAKGVTSGYAPLGVVVASRRIQEPFWSGAGSMFRHGYTYSAHPTACAVGLANLDVLEREGLVKRVADLAPVLAREVSRLAVHPLVAEVRTAGLLAGVELRAETTLQTPDLVDRVVKQARLRGVLTRALVGKALQISPPFVITEAELRQVVDVLEEALSVVARDLTVAAAAS